MNNEPLVSVIIACYNAENYINACFSSLESQTYQNFEIIVCDDCSKDKSLEILLKWAERDKRIIVLHNDKNMYAAATRNKCFNAARGEYFMIQDIDDLSKPNRIEKLIEVLETEKIGFVSSAVETFNEDPSIITGSIKPGKIYPGKLDFLWNVPFVHPATMFKKECIQAVGGYRVAPETRRGQDYDMFMRLYAKGYTGKNVDNTLYLFRVDNDNIKRRTFDARIGEYHIRMKGFSELGMMPWAFPFVLKPFVAHAVQKIKYMGK